VKPEKKTLSQPPFPLLSLLSLFRALLLLLFSQLLLDQDRRTMNGTFLIVNTNKVKKKKHIK
jgi:hypothetical protein